MKTNNVLLLFVLVLMGFFLFTSSVVAGNFNKHKVQSFEGNWCRSSVTAGTVTYIDDRKKDTDGEAWFTVWNCHENIDGAMYVFDKLSNREVLTYGPPRDILGNGIAIGNFVLFPDNEDSGIWEGKWRIVFQDGYSFVRINGKGVGGDIDGYKLKAYFEYESGNPNCSAGAEALFSGFFVVPKHWGR